MVRHALLATPRRGDWLLKPVGRTIQVMSEKVEHLLEEARKLPERERAQLVADLLETLDSTLAVEAAWTAELKRRLEEIRSGRGETLDWAAARRELHGDQ